jgi:TRAP-type C4-dicarboxylate transport system substrate-binding protein
MAPASAQSPKGKSGVVTLNLVSAWTSPDIGNHGLEKFVDRINKEAKSVKINFKGGMEVVPPLEGFAYLSRGMVDLYHTTPAYYAGNLPGAMAGYNVFASQRAMRESGFWDLYDKMHRTKGVTALGQLWRGEPFGLYVNKPITTADLKGLKIRSLPMYDSFLRKLGASVVTMPQGEVYTALEKGVVDGFCYPYGPAFLEKSWYEVVKYVVDPVIPYQSTGVLLANAKQWDALPQQVRKEVMDVILQMEPELYKWYKDEASKNIRKAIDKGLVKEIKLPPKEAQIFQAAAKDAMWNDVVTRSPEYGPKLKELGEKAEKLESQAKKR